MRKSELVFMFYLSVYMSIACLTILDGLTRHNNIIIIIETCKYIDATYEGIFQQRIKLEPLKQQNSELNI